MARLSDPLKMINKRLLQPGIELVFGLQLLFKHADRLIEISLVIHAAATEKSGAFFTAEDHQLGQTLWMAYGLPVIGYGLPGLGDRDSLVKIGANPAGNGGFIGFQSVVTYPEACMEKGLIVLAGSVQVMN